MKTNLLLAFLLLVKFASSSDNTKADLVARQIVYRSDKASEVILVWGINEWQTPDSAFIPKGSYIKDKLVYTTMQRLAADSFSITVNVPDKTKIDYVLWLSKDRTGNPLDWWDNNNKNNYHAYATKAK